MKPVMPLLTLAFALGACTSAPPPRTAEATTTAAQGALARAPLGAAGTARDGEPIGPPRVGVACRLSVTDPVGCDAAQIEALVAPVRARLEGCRGVAGGKVRIRVSRASGTLSFDVEPGASLDPTERRCVLEALGSIHDAASARLSTGASVPPTGFTSLLTVEW
jgi:hypothetical protein